MMDLDPVLLARIQFGLTIMFHYLFPPLSIGLGVLMAILEGLYLWTGNREWETLTRFWTKIFAVNFAMGVSTGIVMEFQFGTNWANYSRYVGDVFGSALAAEGIFAFFLESGFLAVLVFGWDRVSPRMHFFSTCMVALGAIFSSVWIVVANSWQQTPAGHHIVEVSPGVFRAEIVDFWAMVFNPSSVERLVHVLLGAFILGASFMMSVSAFYLLRGRYLSLARRNFTVALWFGTICSLLMPISGHFQAETVAQTQPAKLAAFEGIYHTTREGTPLYLFGIPNDEKQRVDAGIAIPGMLSYLVYQDWDRPVKGLDRFDPQDRPPVAVPFYCYHLMVGLGSFFILLNLIGLFFWWCGSLERHRWLLWIFVLAVGGAYVANQVGWVAAEVGRQPWVVYGLLRTSDGISEVVPAEYVLGSIIMFSAIYITLFGLFIFILNSKIQAGPETHEAHPSTEENAGFLEVAADRSPAEPKRMIDE